MLGNDSINIFPWESTHATVVLILLGNGSVNTPKTIRYSRRRRFPWGPPQGYITGNSEGAVGCQKLREFSWRGVVVKNWVEFWRWQSKVTEKKCQERELGGAKNTSFVIWSDSESYKSVARIRLVKTENTSACLTVNCNVCRSAIALYCL
jgi:hypothetical protein